MDNLEYVNYAQSTVENESGGDMEDNLWYGVHWDDGVCRWGVGELPIRCRKQQIIPPKLPAQVIRDSVISMTKGGGSVTSRKSRCSRRVLREGGRENVFGCRGQAFLVLRNHFTDIFHQSIVRMRRTLLETLNYRARNGCETVTRSALHCGLKNANRWTV